VTYHQGQSDEADFEALLDRILRDRGMDCRQYKPSFLRRRFAVRMRALNAQSYAEYAARLAACDAEYDHLFSALTINLSYFFRDATLFDSLREGVLPALVDGKALELARAGRYNRFSLQGVDEHYVNEYFSSP